MKAEGKLIKKFIGVPIKTKLMIIISIIVAFVALMLPTKFDQKSLVKESEMADYQCYNGTEYRAGVNVYLDITGIDTEVACTKNDRNFYVTMDNGLNGNEKGFYYLVTLDEQLYNELDIQKAYYSGESDHLETYRLWGRTATPSQSFIEEIMEEFNLTQDEYYSYFGNTYLIVNDYRYTAFSDICYLVFFISLGCLITGIVQYFAHLNKIKQTVKKLNQQGYLQQADNELANSFVSRENPFLTDSFLFNKTTGTVTKLADIWLVYERKNKLFGYSKFNVIHPLTNNNKNDINNKVIEAIKAKNDQLLIGNSAENIKIYEDMLLNRFDPNNENVETA